MMPSAQRRRCTPCSAVSAGVHGPQQRVCTPLLRSTQSGHAIDSALRSPPWLLWAPSVSPKRETVALKYRGHGAEVGAGVGLESSDDRRLALKAWAVSGVQL